MISIQIKRIIRKMHLSLVTIVLLINYACTKNDSPSVPQILINSPVEGSEYMVTDTITISGEVSDITGISSISFSLEDTDFINVLPGFSRKIDNLSKYPFKALLAVNDVRIESGYYYLKIVASNAENLKRKYVKIYLNQPARQTEGVILTTSSQNSSKMLFSYNGKDFDVLYSFQGQITNSIADSYNQQIYFSASNPDGIFCFGIADSALRWEEYPPGTYSEITALRYDGLLYYGTEKGDIRGLNISGITKFTTEAKTDTVPENIITTKDYLITDNRLNSNPDHLLIVYYKISGQEIKVFNTGIDIQTFRKVADDKIFFFANSNNQGLSGYYYPEYNYIEETFQLNNTITSVLVVDAENYLLISENKLYNYSSFNHSLNEIFLDCEVTNLAFNEVSNEIMLITTDNRIAIIEYPDGEIVSVSDPVTDESTGNIHILYNY